ncbi:unnamed protein product [Moneuplotes crassus]|uniref:Uncharacterized protein n=1 Tax=Euplotes crassus TaxID=5936 RepID=A0AAD1Y4E4_EUPCR|nr:unnamed protein product [Moneuplotes crassus]
MSGQAVIHATGLRDCLKDCSYRGSSIMLPCNEQYQKHCIFQASMSVRVPYFHIFICFLMQIILQKF